MSSFVCSVFAIVFFCFLFFKLTGVETKQSSCIQLDCYRLIKFIDKAEQYSLDHSKSKAGCSLAICLTLLYHSGCKSSRRTAPRAEPSTEQWAWDPESSLNSFKVAGSGRWRNLMFSGKTTGGGGMLSPVSACHFLCHSSPRVFFTDRVLDVCFLCTPRGMRLRGNEQVGEELRSMFLFTDSPLQILLAICSLRVTQIPRATRCLIQQLLSCYMSSHAYNIWSW